MGTTRQTSNGELQRLIEMPRNPKPARLAIRIENGRRMWVIRDGQNYCRTGLPEGDIDAAEAKLLAYIVERYGEANPAPISLGTVYYISVAGSDTYPIKIGWTNGPVAERLAALQCGNPNLLTCLASEVGKRDLELERHDQFHWSIYRGEWYERTEAVMAHISRLTADVHFHTDADVSERNAQLWGSINGIEREQDQPN
jgi:hypothetical protein